jgi:hypothetical protein
MAYAVGQSVEVCLDFDPPPARGIRRIVGIFENHQGQVVELSDVPNRMSECVVQEPAQIALQGRAAYPGVYAAGVTGGASGRRDSRRAAGDQHRGERYTGGCGVASGIEHIHPTA